MKKIIKAVFVDTSAFIALNNASEIFHKKAVSISKNLHEERIGIFTASHILMETATILSRYISHIFAVEFLNTVRSGGITILYPTREDLAQAEIFFRKQNSNKVSYADCLSFALMKSYNLTNAFSFNENFNTNGFKLVR